MKYAASFILTLLLVSSVFALSACTKKVYICYNGTQRSDASQCPIITLPEITQSDAGRAMDSYGVAVAQAKRDMYTRVNMYNQNTSWYATVIFSNSETGKIDELLFKIDGKTAGVTCISGCDYLTRAK